MCHLETPAKFNDLDRQNNVTEGDPQSRVQEFVALGKYNSHFWDMVRRTVARIIVVTVFPRSKVTH